MKKGERSELLGKLHREASASEESADNDCIRQPVGTRPGRNRQPVGELHQS